MFNCQLGSMAVNFWTFDVFLSFGCLLFCCPFFPSSSSSVVISVISPSAPQVSIVSSDLQCSASQSQFGYGTKPRSRVTSLSLDAEDDDDSSDSNNESDRWKKCSLSLLLFFSVVSSSFLFADARSNHRECLKTSLTTTTTTTTGGRTVVN